MASYLALSSLGEEKSLQNSTWFSKPHGSSFSQLVANGKMMSLKFSEQVAEDTIKHEKPKYADINAINIPIFIVLSDLFIMDHPRFLPHIRCPMYGLLLSLLQGGMVLLESHKQTCIYSRFLERQDYH
mgnify:CR=1 FL=1